MIGLRKHMRLVSDGGSWHCDQLSQAGVELLIKQKLVSLLLKNLAKMY